uniref:leucine-rich repeat protein n=1 Tax=Alistipes sp. TaxID=1872444 RepID=UPI0040561290
VPADASKDLSLSKCEMTVTCGAEVPIVISVPQAPARRNWRTNLVGSLLTESANITVEIMPVPEGEYNPDAVQGQLNELIMKAGLGGEVTLTEDVTLNQSLNVQADMIINLNGHNLTITAAYDDNNYEASSAIVNNSMLTLTGNGTIKATNNYSVRNNGTMIIDGVTIENGIMNFGDLTIESGNISNSRTGKHAIYGNNAKLTINGGEFHNENPGNATIFAYGGEVVINDGEFSIADGTSTLGWTSCLIDAQGSAKYTLNGGAFNGDIRDYNNNTKVYGGTYTHNSVVNFVADGYKAIEVSGVYYIFPEAITDAATTAGVTAVTESVADVATALATDNSEITLYVWNDVAYVAKYGEVTISASAEGTTTTRYIVEESTVKTATVAEGIEVVGNRTFRRCYSLETVTLPNTLTEIGPSVFQSCNNLTNVTIPNGVTTIGEGAFSECTSLTSIAIPAGVTRLEKDVLRATGLTSIEIPASVTYLGVYAFRDCESLAEVKILAPSFTMETSTFLNAAAPYPTMTIYVVNAEMKAYVESMIGTHALTYTTVVVM